MGKKRGPKTSERDIAEAAYWRVSQPDLSPQALARKLGLNATTLKKRIDEAVNRGWITNDWIFRLAPSKLDEVLAATTASQSENALIEHFGRKQLPKLTVVPAWPPKGATVGDEKEIEETNRRMVAHRAAQILLERLPCMKDIGLLYGRTLRILVDELEHYSIAERVPPLAVAPQESPNPDDPSPPSSQNEPERTIYTIMGALSFPFTDERHGDYLEYSASHLTNRLAKVLGRNCKRYFLDTPVYVPLAFLDEHSGDKPSGGIGENKALEIAAEFVKHIPTYHDLFDNGEDSAINKLDTIISSVGDLETGFGTRPDKLAPFLREHEKKILLSEAVGDIAGRYVAQDGGTGKKGTTIANVNARIFGLELQHLESIAERAEKNNTPGVIVIAASPAKAKVIFALLNRTPKVISELIISDDLAKKLLELCKNERL